VEQLPLTIDVDDHSGEWSVDGLRMVLVPRHLVTNNLAAVEHRVGREASAELHRTAGYRSAYDWCRHEADRHGLDGPGVFRHYLTRLTQRGWGQFAIEELDLPGGQVRVTVAHSALAVARDGTEPCCYMFEGWLEGAVAYARPADDSGTGIEVREVACSALGAPHCEFQTSIS
jgi:predicted hydrocarbon binding protein